MKDYNEIAANVLEQRDRYIAERKKRQKRAAVTVSCFAVLLLAGFGIWKSGLFEKSPVTNNPSAGSPFVLNAYAISEAKYPESTLYPNSAVMDDSEYAKAFDAWYDEYGKKKNAYKNAEVDIDDFLAVTLREFLSGEETENKVYSPLNLYMALSMLSEVTDGNSRAQILNLIGTDSLESLRKEANALWNMHYSDDGRTKSLLSSSLWLDETVGFNESVMNRLSENYYASVYRGKMGGTDFTKAMRTWLNQQTGGILEDQIENLEMTPNTVMALITTVYYEASWQEKFLESENETLTFYGANGETEAEFLCEVRLSDDYYSGEKFGAVKKELNGGTMWFILPDSGYSPSELLHDNETIDFILSNGARCKTQKREIHFKTPKFDVTSQIDLIEPLRNLGVTDVFDQNKSDFSAMTAERRNLAITSAVHGARVMIDEDGCTASAYTAMLTGVGAPEEAKPLDFVLDRPFVFVITSEVGLPMFVGVVNQV